MAFHVAIIMDGNGRWAESRGLPRLAGHGAGVDALQRAVEASVNLGVTDLTVYAFSSDIWRRPAEEVNGLMRLFRRYLDREVARCVANGIRLTVIGRRDRLPKGLPERIAAAEAATRGGRRIHVRLAVDYSSRDALLEAARRCGEMTRERLAAELPAPDVDLLIRTGGEQRLSDFLLWESAYAEFWFTPRMWPEFSKDDLAEAVAAFQSRQRRFGALPAA